MRHLIHHLLREHLPEIASKSLLNCHVQGLHSIMFLDTPEHRVRLFVAEPKHQLHLNHGLDLATLAAHPHHCAITLDVVFGELTNLNFERVIHPGKRGDFLPYRYQSAITGGLGEFVYHEEDEWLSAKYTGGTRVKSGQSLYMPAHQIHSVYVPFEQRAAWFVYEGRENPDYQPYSYSNNNLEQVDFSRLYQPMTEKDVLYLLDTVGFGLNDK